MIGFFIRSFIFIACFLATNAFAQNCINVTFSTPSAGNIETAGVQEVMGVTEALTFDPDANQYVTTPEDIENNLCNIDTDPVSGAICIVQTLVTNAAFAVYCKILAAWTPIVLAMALIYLLMYFGSFLLGIAEQEKPQIFVVKMIKIILIILFATSPALMVESIYMLLLNFMSSTTALVTGTSGGGNGVVVNWELMDYLFNALIGWDMLVMLATLSIALILFLGFSFVTGILTFFGVLTMIFAFMQIFFMYLTAFMAITFLCMFSPIFISFCLFQPTRSFFNRWVGSLISYAFQVVLVTCFVVTIGWTMSEPFFIMMKRLLVDQGYTINIESAAFMEHKTNGALMSSYEEAQTKGIYKLVQDNIGVAPFPGYNESSKPLPVTQQDIDNSHPSVKALMKIDDHPFVLPACAYDPTKDTVTFNDQGYYNDRGEFVRSIYLVYEDYLGRPLLAITDDEIEANKKILGHIEFDQGFVSAISAYMGNALISFLSESFAHYWGQNAPPSFDAFWYKTYPSMRAEGDTYDPSGDDAVAEYINKENAIIAIESFSTTPIPANAAIDRITGEPYGINKLMYVCPHDGVKSPGLDDNNKCRRYNPIEGFPYLVYAVHFGPFKNGYGNVITGFHYADMRPDPTAIEPDETDPEDASEYNRYLYTAMATNSRGNGFEEINSFWALYDAAKYRTQEKVNEWTGMWEPQITMDPNGRDEHFDVFGRPARALRACGVYDFSLENGSIVFAIAAPRITNVLPADFNSWKILRNCSVFVVFWLLFSMIIGSFVSMIPRLAKESVEFGGYRHATVIGGLSKAPGSLGHSSGEINVESGTSVVAPEQTSLVHMGGVLTQMLRPSHALGIGDSFVYDAAGGLGDPLKSIENTFARRIGIRVRDVFKTDA